MKAMRSSRDWNRDIFPETTCSTRPTKLWTLLKMGLHRETSPVIKWQWTDSTTPSVSAPYTKDGLCCGVAREYTVPVQGSHKSSVKLRSNCGQIAVKSRIVL
jgi:hypothetical protein